MYNVFCLHLLQHLTCSVPSYSTLVSTKYRGWPPLISQVLPSMLHDPCRFPAVQVRGRERQNNMFLAASHIHLANHRPGDMAPTALPPDVAPCQPSCRPYKYHPSVHPIGCGVKDSVELSLIQLLCNCDAREVSSCQQHLQQHCHDQLMLQPRERLLGKQGRVSAGEVKVPLTGFTAPSQAYCIATTAAIGGQSTAFGAGRRKYHIVRVVGRQPSQFSEKTLRPVLCCEASMPHTSWGLHLALCKAAGRMVQVCWSKSPFPTTQTGKRPTSSC
jgi:hypothetical protein